MTLRSFITAHRSEIEAKGFSPHLLIEDVVNYWYIIHYGKAPSRMHYKKHIKLLKELCPKTDDLDELWAEISLLLKQTM